MTIAVVALLVVLRWLSTGRKDAVERDKGVHGDVGEEDMCVSEWGRCPWGRSASRVFVEAAGLVEKETRTPMGMSMRRKMKAICEPGDG